MAALAMIALVVWYFMGARGRAVETVLVEAQPIRQTLVFSARVSSVARSEVASTITARVDKVAVREGDIVKPGQILIELEDGEIAAQARQADAAVAIADARLRAQREVNAPIANEALESAQTNHDFTKREFERNRALYDRGFIGQARLQEAERALSVARNALDQALAQQRTNNATGAETATVATRVREAQAARDFARSRLAQTKIVAPAAGRVIARSVEPGDVVQPGRRLLTLALDGETRLIAQIDEKNLALLREGQIAKAAADAFPDARFDAALTYLAPAVDANRGTVEARLKVTKPPTFLRDDMTVSVEVVAAEKAKALTLPTSALRESGGATSVLVIEDGRAVTRSVKIGIRTAQRVEIVEGLAERAVAIIDPNVVAGARVRARDASAARKGSDFEAPLPGR